MNRAFEWYLRAARAGHDQAAYRAARLLLCKAGPEDSVEDVRYALQRAAHGGHAEAQALLGWCHQRGRLVAHVDSLAAIEWLQRAARAGSAGHAKSQWRLSRWLKRDGRSADALRWLEAAAVAGYQRAQFGLARHYLKLNEESDRLQAYLWFHRAAQSGHADASYCVGVCHYQGVGTERNLIEAYRWFQRAGVLGSIAAVKAMASLVGRLAAAQLEQARGPAGRPAV